MNLQEQLKLIPSKEAVPLDAAKERATILFKNLLERNSPVDIVYELFKAILIKALGDKMKPEEDNYISLHELLAPAANDFKVEVNSEYDVGPLFMSDMTTDTVERSIRVFMGSDINGARLHVIPMSVYRGFGENGSRMRMIFVMKHEGNKYLFMDKRILFTTKGVKVEYEILDVNNDIPEVIISK